MRQGTDNGTDNALHRACHSDNYSRTLNLCSAIIALHRACHSDKLTIVFTSNTVS